ncbi:Gfo/Idh/MocA family oxidoreductase [Streptomyces sp. NPDC050485]|uniref:Gfo/Idh/MocA family oxidoreductase n=1 Tax=Streptomyces sp. NPDC050485 TaxID=3365617 RepID=UPI0037A29501
MTHAPLRVVVAGTAFGRIYLDAVRSAPQEFTLAGVLARGGDYSVKLAARHGVPLFTSAEAVPDDIDIACVVVRSGATGGPGSELAQAMLRRGIHVLQEHPVHSTEVAACLRAAKQGGAAYAVNTLYPNLRPIRQFLAAAEFLRARQPIRFLDAACNSQVAYPLLDVLGRAAGGLRPWSFGEPADAPENTSTPQPFLNLNAVIGGVPVTVRVQNQVHPGDPDNHSLLMHRISLGCDAGVLTLADTHGPVLWNPRMHSPRDETGRLVMSGPGTERLAVPSTSVLGEATTRSYHEVFARTWPDAVLVALRGLVRDIAEPGRRARSGQWALAVTRAWSDLTARIGMPELVRPDEPEPIAFDELAAAAEVD